MQLAGDLADSAPEAGRVNMIVRWNVSRRAEEFQDLPKCHLDVAGIWDMNGCNQEQLKESINFMYATGGNWAN